MEKSVLLQQMVLWLNIWDASKSLFSFGIGERCLIVLQNYVMSLFGQVKLKPMPIKTIQHAQQHCGVLLDLRSEIFENENSELFKKNIGILTWDGALSELSKYNFRQKLVFSKLIFRRAFWTVFEKKIKLVIILDFERKFFGLEAKKTLYGRVVETELCVSRGAIWAKQFWGKLIFLELEQTTLVWVVKTTCSVRGNVFGKKWKKI